ncbi:MAG: putative (di)nucleoside polyphosphate hydrolase [Halieaceae bacterium]|jgi:putative (di)nucleoside polyphosphate hydrolase
MIDAQGFRPNVGIVITNDQGRLLWARRIGGRDAWQFPQGGIADGEQPEEALYRELEEEVGLRRASVELLASTRGWLRYRLPRRFQRKGQQPLCIGQKQKWFLLRMLDADEAVTLVGHDKPEFDHWEWVSYWYPLSQVVYFKREVYRRALKELAAPLAAIAQPVSGLASPPLVWTSHEGGEDMAQDA